MLIARAWPTRARGRSVGQRLGGRARQTSDLDGQIDTIAGFRPDLVVILIGANDVTHGVTPSTSVRHLAQAVRRLPSSTPRWSSAPAPTSAPSARSPQPLRLIGRRWSRRLAAAQMITVVEGGGRAVSLGDPARPGVRPAAPGLLSSDRFHPSSLGYRRLAEVLLPTICAALGYGAEPEPALDRDRHEEVLPLSEAAVQAADAAGSELVAMQVDGYDRSSRGRWASLRHRIPMPLRRRSSEGADAGAVAEAEDGEPDAAGPRGRDGGHVARTRLTRQSA